MKRKQCTELCIKFPSVNASCTFKTSHCVRFKYKVKHGLGVVRPGKIVKMWGGGVVFYSLLACSRSICTLNIKISLCVIISRNLEKEDTVMRAPSEF